MERAEASGDTLVTSSSQVLERICQTAAVGNNRKQQTDVAIVDSPINGFAMIFGHCVWLPPSPRAAQVALALFFGIGINREPDITGAEAALASEYVVAGKTPTQAREEVASLDACFRTYEVPPENRNHPRDPDLMPLQNQQSPIDK